MFNSKAGQFIPGNSIIHKIDPRLKILTNLIFIVMIFLSENIFVQLILTSISIFFFLCSFLQKKILITTLKPTLYIAFFIFIICLILLKNDYSSNDKIIYKVLWEWKSIEINTYMLNNVIIIALRIYSMIIMTTLLTTTTSPLDLTKALEDLMLPLKITYIFPVHIVAMIISISFRFIPTLIGEANRIMKAQSSRGVDFKNGSLKTKVKSIITLIIPLFVSAFSKADDLSNAMEARGYDPYEERTRYKKLQIKWFDIIVFFLIIGLLVFVILAIRQTGEKIHIVKHGEISLKIVIKHFFIDFPHLPNLI